MMFVSETASKLELIHKQYILLNPNVYRSKCGNGPNICVTKNDNEEKFFFGISDATSASAVLDVATGEPYPIELLVAADVISKVESSKCSSLHQFDPL